MERAVLLSGGAGAGEVVSGISTVRPISEDNGLLVFQGAQFLFQLLRQSPRVTGGP